MTKEEFKERWESNDDGGGITMDEVADCCRDWGIQPRPETMNMDVVLYLVLKKAQVSDLEEYLPERRN